MSLLSFADGHTRPLPASQATNDCCFVVGGGVIVFGATSVAGDREQPVIDGSEQVRDKQNGARARQSRKKYEYSAIANRTLCDVDRRKNRSNLGRPTNEINVDKARAL